MSHGAEAIVYFLGLPSTIRATQLHNANDTFIFTKDLQYAALGADISCQKLQTSVPVNMWSNVLKEV